MCAVFLFTASILSITAPESVAQAAADSAQTLSALDKIAGSVVHVYSTVRYPDLFNPWKKRPPQEITGSGFVIEGNRIVTNAHVVLYARDIQILGNGSGDKLSARLESIDPDMDLAVLRLDDEGFFAGHPALALSTTIPRERDSVLVYGYPAGGSGLAVTKGIVSRIEFARYSTKESGLRVQIDAAVNHGNSGGPVLAADKVIGVAFSFLGGAQNISYIIPSEEVRLFLKESIVRPFAGKPCEQIAVQKLENLALRRSLNLPSSAHGVMVTNPGNPDVAYPIKIHDVITKVGEDDLDNLGNVVVDGDLKVSFGFAMQRQQKDGVVPVTVFRDGTERRVNLRLETKSCLLSKELAGSYPSYFILGPIAFSEATMELVKVVTMDSSFSPVVGQNESPLVTRAADFASFDGESIVFVPNQFFTHSLAKGYSNPALKVVAKVNGIAIRNLAHLVEVIRDSTAEFIDIEFADLHSERIVFRRSEVLDATADILASNDIRSQGSEDIMKVWRSKEASR